MAAKTSMNQNYVTVTLCILFWSRFLRFNVFFYFPNVFYFKKKRWQSLERQAD